MYAWIYQPGQQLCKRNDRKEKPPLLASVYARIDQPFSVRCPALVTLSLENAQVPVDGSPSFGLDDKRENYTSLIVISIINDLYHLINLTSMPSVRCPRCGKKFKDQTSLLQHMNQPISSCLTHFEERIDIATALQSDPTISESDESDDMGRQSFEAPDFMDTAEDLLLASLIAGGEINEGGKKYVDRLEAYKALFIFACEAGKAKKDDSLVLFYALVDLTFSPNNYAEVLEATTTCVTLALPDPYIAQAPRTITDAGLGLTGRSVSLALTNNAVARVRLLW